METNGREGIVEGRSHLPQFSTEGVDPISEGNLDPPSTLRRNVYDRNQKGRGRIGREMETKGDGNKHCRGHSRC